jgi:hypothetical protein
MEWVNGLVRFVECPKIVRLNVCRKCALNNNQSTLQMHTDDPMLLFEYEQLFDAFHKLSSRVFFGARL